MVLLPYAIFVTLHHQQATTVEGPASPPAATAATRSLEDPETYKQVLLDAHVAIQRANQLVPSKPGATVHVQTSQPRTASTALRRPPPTPPAPAALPARTDGGVIEGRNLVVGLGTGITPENLAVFAGSLRAVNPTAALVLYLDSPLPPKHVEIVEKYQVTAIEFSEDLLEPSFLRKYHPSNYRWPLLYRFLLENEHAFRGGKVLLADTRDTMFQTDPFAAFGEGFFAFHGVESRTIAQCGWNGGWIRDCFGQAMLSRVGENHIICSGISMGSTAEVLAYLQLMKDEMETPEFARCERNGVDQGVHNVLVHTRRIPQLQVKSQANGWVANMQAGRSSIDEDGVVRNPSGQVVAVVHQYDRNRPLQERFFEKFTFWDRSAENVHCKPFRIEENVDLFKAKCDLKVVGAHSNDACCEKCLATAGCKGWSAAGSMCYLKNCNNPSNRVSMIGVASGYLP